MFNNAFNQIKLSFKIRQNKALWQNSFGSALNK